MTSPDFSTLTQYLEHWATSEPDALWLRDLLDEGTQDFTWGEGVAQINTVAAALEQRFGHGVSMMLVSRNRAHWVLADMAVISSGNVTVPLFTSATPSTVEYIADFVEARVIFVGESPNWEAIRPVLSEDVVVIALPGVDPGCEHVTWAQLLAEGSGNKPRYEAEPDDVFSLVFTSGTTGLPKGVMQTHNSTLIPIRRSDNHFDWGQGRRQFSYLPLAHLAERQIVECSSIVHRGEVSFIRRLETLAEDLQRTRPFFFFGAPRVWEQLRQAVIAKFGGQEAFDAAFAANPEAIGQAILSGLGLDECEYALTASAPTPPPLIHWWRDLGLKLYEAFGQTEAMSILVSTEEENRIGSVGKPIGEVEIRIADDGELLLRANGLTPGYYKNPEKTAELFTDGWLRTGDRARIDEDGFVYITGRVKDYFKTIHGKFVAPPPIEGLFARNALVGQQCLIGTGFSKTVMVVSLVDAAAEQGRDDVEAALRQTVADVNAEIEAHARIGAVVITPEIWTIENEILTPTLKVKRDRIEAAVGAISADLARQAAEQKQVLVHWHAAV